MITDTHEREAETEDLLPRVAPCRKCRTNRNVRWNSYRGRTWWLACGECNRQGPEEQSVVRAVTRWNEKQSQGER